MTRQAPAHEGDLLSAYTAQLHIQPRTSSIEWCSKNATHQYIVGAHHLLFEGGHTPSHQLGRGRMFHGGYSTSRINNRLVKEAVSLREDPLQ